MRRLACRRVRPILDLLADGRPPEREMDHIRAHLATCDGCRREHAGLARLRAALADQPRVAMRADALERLQARLAAKGRPAPARRAAVAACGLAALVALAAGLPRLMHSVGERESVVVAASPIRASAAAASHRTAPGAASVAREFRPMRPQRAAANRGQSSLRPLRSRRGTVPGGVRSREAASPAEAGGGSVIVVIVTPREARTEPRIALRVTGVEGPEGAPEAMMTMAETRGEDGSVQHLDYGYHPTEPEGTAKGSGFGPREEGIRDGDDTQGDPQSGVGDSGSGLNPGPVVRGAEAA